jgi:hypothetical protein
MPPTERLRHVIAKLDRANQHIEDLERLHKTFIKSNPYKIGTKTDPQTSKLIYYITSVEQPGDTIATTVGDILQNLISTLDHLAYQLVCVGKGHDGPFTYVYFPIADSPTKYEATKLGKIKGMRPVAIKAIDAIKPYKGGNDLLWCLYKLNNVDKHRLLVTVGSAFRSVNLGAHIHQMMNSMWSEKGITLPMLDFYVKPADRLFPLKAGDELFIDAPNAKVNEKMQFVFEVAFGEPRIIEGQPLLKTLHEFKNLVDGIVTSLSPILA